MLTLRAELSFRQPEDGAQARRRTPAGASTGSAGVSTGSAWLSTGSAVVSTGSAWVSTGSAGAAAESPARASRNVPPAPRGPAAGARLSNRAAPAGPDEPSRPSGYVAPGLRALEDDTIDIPGGRRRISAENDRFHHVVNPRSKHTRGLAFDQALRDPSRSAAAAEHMRARLRGAGLSEREFRVIDEYRHPSRHSTGGHIHTQFNSAEAARRYDEFTRKRAEARKSLER